MQLHKQAYGFDAETQEFSDGIVDMFLGIRAGHLGRYCFSSAYDEKDSVRGDEHWTKFIGSSQSYYPYRHELEIIREASQQIGQLVADADTFVDLGTGSLGSFEGKVLPILRNGNFRKLIFVDLCTAFADLAADRLKQESLHIGTSAFIANFFNQLPVLSSKSVINLFGITLGNFIVDLPRETPEQGLERAMRHFAAPLAKHGGYFVFDYDTNEDERSIHACYDHPSYHAMEMTILERVKRDLPTQGFEPSDFEHVTVWYPQWNLLAQELRAKRAVRFRLGPHMIALAEGTSFRTGSSFKYSDSLIEAAASKAGLVKMQVDSLPGSTMRVAVYGMKRPSLAQILRRP
jgi:uncharacterized SAM-dependent methyltransferase